LLLKNFWSSSNMKWMSKTSNILFNGERSMRRKGFFLLL
jgi:hypothetical protein